MWIKTASKQDGSGKTGEVIPFGRIRIEDEPEISGITAPVSVKPRATKLNVTTLDLTGKTHLARYLGWRMAEEGRSGLIAALDPSNRSLATWFEGVEQPETSDGNKTARWLRAVLTHLMSTKGSGILDHGGGDTALAKLIDLAPDFADRMIADGVEPIACHTLGPTLDDITGLESLETSGFKPRSTLLVLNEGRVDSVLSREEAFARILRHSAFKNAIARGAIPIWMPKLEPEVAAEIEGKRLTFGQARDGLVPEGRTFSPIGGLERSMVIRWLERMEQEFHPVVSWMP